MNDYYYYFILVIIPLLFGLYAQYKVSSAYKKYSEKGCSGGWTGEKAARMILDQNELYDVQIERVAGNLTDHYDPRSNMVRLSDGVYSSCSIAAVGIAAHECGHAIQHAKGYAPMKVRSAVVPVTNIGSKMAVPLVVIGLLLSWYPLAYIGLIGYALIAVFQLITLPVEFNASGRAVAALSEMNISEKEEKGIKAVLNAAAMTYVAALVAVLGQLLHLLRVINRRR